MSTGAELIAQERKRQIEVEGWTAEHDDEHVAGDTALAGACYALDAVATISEHAPSWTKEYKKAAMVNWPWDWKWWKPTPENPIRQLTKAGALIAAEIDKLQRKQE